MIINFVIGILVCFIFTLYLYLSYADPKTKSFVSIIVFLTWFLNFINIVIIPCDLYINYQREINKTDYERDNLNIKTLWIILYWIIFLNSWFIIPIVLDYEKAGDFTIKNKLKRAIKTNLFFYLLLVIIGIVFISYLIIKKNLNWNNLGIFLIALSNAWGIFVVILILGYGLVALPKKLWKLSDYNLQMQFLEWKASDTKENLDEHISELSILKIKIKYFKLLPDNNIDSQMILDEVCLELDKIPNYPNFSLEEQLKKNTKQFNIEDIVKINQNEILLEWQFLKEITKQVYDDNSIGINKMFFLRVRPKLLIILSLFCSTLSFIVVFSEITLFLDIKLSLFGFFISLTRNNIYAINLFCIIPLIYMFVSALFGLFSFKFSGYYGMYKNKKTNSISLLFVANFMCRIGFALCVNYLQILKLNIKTSLDEVLGNINLVPIFGSSFPLFYPFVLVFLCLFNLFNLSGKLLSFLGFTTFETKDEFNKEKLLDGINIIEDLQRNKTDLFNIQENNYDYENKTSDMSKNLLKGNNEEDFKKIRNSSL